MWQTRLGRIIYESPNGAKVYQNFKYRWLTLGSSAIQTLINRHKPNKFSLCYFKELSLALRIKPADCCLLGLGGAALAHSLTPYIKDFSITAVESNLEVINIAKNYFMLEQIKNLKIIHQDASLFVKESNQQYQHLLVDLSDANSFPNACNSKEFFKNCREKINDDGVLAVNLANLNEQWEIFTHIRDVFPNCTVTLPINGFANMVILASKSNSITKLLKTLKDSKNLKKLVWDTKWGCIANL